MGKFSLAELFGMTIRESANDGSDFANPDAGQLVRRLPGFVGLHRTPGATGSAGESLWGRVIFIHSDRPLILHSLSVLHELADSGQLWDTGRRFIDFAGRIS